MTLTAAELGRFQLDKNASGTPVFTHYSVNSDSRCYAVADAATDIPAPDTRMTAAQLHTTCGDIHLTLLATSGQNYRGRAVNDVNQGCMKFLFETIHSTTNVVSGEILESAFSWEIR